MREGVHLSSESAGALVAKEYTAQSGQQAALSHLLPETEFKLKTLLKKQSFTAELHSIQACDASLLVVDNKLLLPQSSASHLIEQHIKQAHLNDTLGYPRKKGANFVQNLIQKMVLVY